MAPLDTTSRDPAATERRVLDTLIALYEEERRIYRHVLELSQRQEEIVSTHGAFNQVRSVLQEKKECLATISRLEAQQEPNRIMWREGRQNWSTTARSRMHRILQEIGDTIEEILQCEERNDQLLLEQMG